MPLMRARVCCLAPLFVVNFIVRATRDATEEKPSRSNSKANSRRQKESLIKLALPFCSNDSRPLLERRKEDEAEDRAEEET